MTDTVVTIEGEVEAVVVEVEIPGLRGSVGPGVPLGGTDGQVLAKASDDDYDLEYITVPSFAGAALVANNLSDLLSTSTALTNLGGTTVGKAFFTLTDPSAIRFVRVNANNSVSLLTNVQMVTALGISGAGTGDLLAVNNLDDLDDASIARTNLGLALGTDVQAYDADLAALAALSGTNTIYYRSAADTWSAVTIGTDLTFSAGTLSADIAATVQSYLPPPGEGSSGAGTGTFPTASRYRLRTLAPGSDGVNAGWGEIEFTYIDFSGVPLVGTASASSAASGFPASEAFDSAGGIVGNGWLCDTGAEAVIGSWVEFAFTTPATVAKVSPWPIKGEADRAPTSFIVEYYDSTWKSLGTFTTTWASDYKKWFDLIPPDAAPGTDAPSDGKTYGRKNAAYVEVQPLDADLTAIAGLTSAADKVPYFTGSGTAALATLTTFGRSLIDDADKAAGQTTLGIVVIADQATYDALGSYDSTTIYLVKE